MSYKGQYKRVYLAVESEQKLSDFKKVLNFLGFLDETTEGNCFSVPSFPRHILVDCIRGVYQVCAYNPSEGVKVSVDYIVNNFSEFPELFCIYTEDPLGVKEALNKLNYLDWHCMVCHDRVVVSRLWGATTQNATTQNATMQNAIYDSLSEELESKTIEQVVYNFDINSIVNNPLPEKVFIATNGDEKLSARVQRLMQARGYDWQHAAYKGSVRFTDADYLLFDSVEKAMYQSSDDYENMQEDGWRHIEVEDLEQVPLVFPPWNIPQYDTKTVPESVNPAHDDFMDAAKYFEPVLRGAEKAKNPKLAIGNASLPMTLLSPITIATGCLGKLNGKLKYGGSNYIGTEVIMSTYMDAIARHFTKIQLGEDVDSVDNVPHWGAIIANIDIILSAKAAGTLIDDRLRSDGQLEAIQKLVPLVKNLQELHKDKNPKHYLLSDYNYFLKGNYD